MWSSASKVLSRKLSVCRIRTFIVVPLEVELVSVCTEIPVEGFSPVTRSQLPREMLRASAGFVAPCRLLSEGEESHCQAREQAAFGTEPFPACPYSIQLVSELVFLNFMLSRMKSLNVFMARCDTTSAVVIRKHFILANFIPLVSQLHRFAFMLPLYCLHAQVKLCIPQKRFLCKAVKKTNFPH